MNRETRDKMILNNLRLVGKVINNKIDYNQDNYEDLYMCGIEGLINAVNKFDESKNIKFSTYAYKCIYNEIINNIKTIQPPFSVSLNYPPESNPGASPLIEIIKDDSINIEEDYLIKEEKEFINNLLHKIKLPDKKRFIILLHYGFYNKKAYTRQELANIFKVSDRYIGEVIRDFLKKADYYIKKEYGEEILENRNKYRLYYRCKKRR